MHVWLGQENEWSFLQRKNQRSINLWNLYSISLK